MKTTITTTSKTVKIQAYSEGLRENNGQGNKLFGYDYTTNAYGYDFEVKLPFLFIMVSVFKK